MNDNKKTNSSIVYKLTAWHISQMLASFITVSLIVVLVLFGWLFYHGEKYIEDIAQTPPTQFDNIENEPPGLKFPEFVDRFTPDQIDGAYREFVSNKDIEPFWQRIKTTTYRVWVPIPKGDGFYSVDYEIGQYISIILILLIVLSIFMVLELIEAFFKGLKAIRTALKPIYDLTETTKNINSKSISQPEIQLKDLRGTIDTINVTDLNKRITISSDQSELKDLAEAINGMLDRINDAYRSQARFVSDASHELRTPIAVIQGYANLLDRWGKNDEDVLQESIDAIKSEANSMKDLVEQLLFLARSDNNTLQLNVEEINLSELTEEIVRETKMIDSNHYFSMNADSHVYTMGDIQLIKQAIRIFVDNSVKYTPSGETIAIKTFQDNDLVKIIVQDNGIGIDEGDVANVFERFYRSDDSRARKTGGTGLGLSIAKWIIDRHNGSVEVLSRKDIGTRITISLASSVKDDM